MRPKASGFEHDAGQTARPALGEAARAYGGPLLKASVRSAQGTRNGSFDSVLLNLHGRPSIPSVVSTVQTDGDPSHGWVQAMGAVVSPMVQFLGLK